MKVKAAARSHAFTTVFSNFTALLQRDSYSHSLSHSNVCRNERCSNNFHTTHYCPSLSLTVSRFSLSMPLNFPHEFIKRKSVGKEASILQKEDQKVITDTFGKDSSYQQQLHKGTNKVKQCPIFFVFISLCPFTPQSHFFTLNQ